MTLEARSVQELLAHKYPSLTLVEHDLLTRGGRLLLGGGPGIGKSFVILELATELALGIPALGKYAVRDALNVLLIQLELSEGALQRRMRRIAEAYGVAEKLWLASPRDFTLPEREDALLQFVIKRQIDVVAIDPYYLAHQGGENTLEDVLPSIRSVNRVIADAGCSFIIVVHTKKPLFDTAGMKIETGSDAISGHRALINWADTIGMFYNRPGGLHLAWTKTRNSDGKVDALDLVWTPGLPLALAGSPLAMTADAGPKNAVLKVLLAGGAIEQAALFTSSGLSESVFRRTLKLLQDSGQVAIERKGRNNLVRAR